MSLYLKYRPSALEEMRGNKEVLGTLDRMLSDPKTCPHVFLLSGQTGVGKTTVARIIASRLGVNEADFTEINASDMRGIDTVREVIKNSQYLPIKGDYRLWLLDEIQMGTSEAQNALLKLLEDTPQHAFFVLSTTNPEKLIAPLVGRCSHFQLKPLTEEQMMVLLKKTARAEGKKVQEAVLQQIVIDSMGLPRNALQVLEQVLSVDEEQQLEVAKRVADQQSQIIELCRALLQQKNWSTVKKILNGLKNEQPETVRRAVLGYCQSVLLREENDTAAMVMELFLEPLYNTGFPGLVFASYSAVKS